MVPIALSPCPNDTFLFHAWIKRLIDVPLRIDPYFADIEQLNEWALEGRFPIVKVSLNCMRQILDRYQLLHVGCALGFQCGPKIIAMDDFPPNELYAKKIAIPGAHTTAHLLMERLIGPVREKHFCLYHEIGSLLKQKTVDCGVIIHESRFTFGAAGFKEIADLGTLWEKRYGLPLPLGGIAIRRDLSHAFKEQVISALRASLLFAKTYPLQSRPFILQYSQEKDPVIIAAHIETYVNNETSLLSPMGRKAIEVLMDHPTSDFLFDGSVS